MEKHEATMTASLSTSGAIIAGTDDDDVVTATQSPAGQPLPMALDAPEASDLILAAQS